MNDNSTSPLPGDCIQENQEMIDEISAREHSMVNLPDTTVLRSQELGQDGNSDQPGVLTEEQQGDAMNSDERRPPISPPLLPLTDHTQNIDLNIARKIACWMTGIYVSGILGVLMGLPGNLASSRTEKILLKVCLATMSVSFVFGVMLLIFALIRPKFTHLIPIVKVIMWLAVVLVMATIGLGTCILLDLELKNLHVFRHH